MTTYGVLDTVPEHISRRDITWTHDFELSTRTINVIRWGTDWTCPQDVIEASDADILRIPNCGRKTLRELRETFYYSRSPILRSPTLRNPTKRVLILERIRIIEQDLVMLRNLVEDSAP